MMTTRQGLIAALLVGSIVGGTAGATILTAASASHEQRISASLQRDTQETPGLVPTAR